MLRRENIEIGTANLTFTLIGEGKQTIVIEPAVGTFSLEWMHIAQRIGDQFKVLLYDRAGYGGSSPSILPRNPANIAKELLSLLQALHIEDSLILVGHAHGGLFAQQFALLYPEMVDGLILIDPAPKEISALRCQVPRRVYDLLRIDEGRRFQIASWLAKWHLIHLLKPVLFRMPPFTRFTGLKGEEKDILFHSFTRRSFYDVVLEEYRFMDGGLQADQNGRGWYDEIPLILITHDSGRMIETMIGNGLTRAEAERVEELWQDGMKRSLYFTANACHFQTKWDVNTHPPMDVPLMEKSIMIMNQRLYVT